MKSSSFSLQSETVQKIAKEATYLDPLEQALLLTRLRVKRLRKKRIDNIANPEKEIRFPTMKEIDKWKHESRKSS